MVLVDCSSKGGEAAWPGVQVEQGACKEHRSRHSQLGREGQNLANEWCVIGGREAREGLQSISHAAGIGKERGSSFKGRGEGGGDGGYAGSMLCLRTALRVIQDSKEALGNGAEAPAHHTPTATKWDQTSTEPGLGPQ